MNFPVDVGEKYALIALNADTDIQSPVDLGSGISAHPEGSFELPGHWKKWLGSMRAEDIEKSSLFLIIKTKSEHPAVLDGQNLELMRKAGNLYWGLLASDRLALEGAGTHLTGANSGDGPDVRQIAELHRHVRVLGMMPKAVTEAHLRRAKNLAFNLQELLAMPGMRRMQLAISTFLLAFTENDLGERIHQFVRALDGVTRVRDRHEFKKRSVLLAGPDYQDLCLQLYAIRSNIEHFNDPEKGLDVLPSRESQLRACRYSIAAEALARHCFSHLVENRQLWPHFTDDQVESFWKRPIAEQSQIWGPAFDLTSALAGFRPEWVPHLSDMGEDD
ncbi:hypothetical protein JYK02_14585 [Corallococcus macrosporus]|uniref:Apea-like HEPN domain-containing protein n=1 Tax=Corallococcus macrosporus TaxID=35 RepID=A0ABS3DAR5_9BACT|nr:hypothetical protein [Corallococcus macrosporus]MBN8228733.1 hypothetical protein [Corallococcus macrosporus]